MDDPDTKGLIFVDESNINDGAYGALGAVFVLAEHAEAITAEIADVTEKLRELKWNETSDGRHKRAALKVVDVIVPRAEAGHLRIETLSWSKTDSRHAVFGRDDYANMERMLVHLTVNGMSKWRSVASWDLNPDVLANVDFERTRTGANSRIALRAGGEWMSRFDVVPEIAWVNPTPSESHALVQVADLFAGIAQYVRTDAVLKAPQSKSEKARHEILLRLLPAMARKSQLRWLRTEGIVTSRGAPINFWAYRAQGDYDRAPTTKPDEFVPELRTCKDCGELFWADAKYKTWCLACYVKRRREVDRKNDVAEAARVRRGGRWYCHVCLERYSDDEAATMLSPRTYEPVPTCPKHKRVPLTAIAAAEVAEWHDERIPKKPEIRRPNVQLDRPSYRDQS